MYCYKLPIISAYLLLIEVKYSHKYLVVVQIYSFYSGKQDAYILLMWTEKVVLDALRRLVIVMKLSLSVDLDKQIEFNVLS